MKACKGPLFHSHFPHQHPALFVLPKKHMGIQKEVSSLFPAGLSRVGNMHVTVCGGLSSFLGGSTAPRSPLLCLVHRCNTKGIPAYPPKTALSSRRAPAQRVRERQRWFGPVSWNAGSVLETANVIVCVSFWPLNNVAFGQVLKAARVFNQISYFFPKFPSDWFATSFAHFKGWDKALTEVSNLSADWCHLHALLPTASPENHEWELKHQRLPKRKVKIIIINFKITF